MKYKVQCVFSSTLFYLQMEYPKRMDKSHHAQLSVIIMGTDAVSRGNFRRNMPRTFNYLKKDLDAVDLQGFTKVGDNTDPNLTAVLMGLTVDELKHHSCQTKRTGKRHNKGKMDNCPLIWRNFSDSGYATAYAEDGAWMGVYHFNKIGFVKEPTDYYNRPYFLVSEEHISHNGGIGGGNAKLCQGEKKSMTVVHDYSLAVAETLQDMPYFGFYWTASITHDYLNMARGADQPSLSYLKTLRAKGWY